MQPYTNTNKKICSVPLNLEPRVSIDIKLDNGQVGLTEFFFAHPYSSWERGLSEYTNKLVRQYIPKKSIFSLYSEKEIKNIQHKIN